MGIKVEDDKRNNKIVKYDNSFNKTSLSVLTEVQSDILMSVLERMGNKISKDIHGNNCYVARYKFKEIREMINSKNMHAHRVKKVFDDLLNTKVEMYEDGIYTKANLFSSYSLTDRSTAEITLSSQLTQKMITGKTKYTILELDEYVKLKNKYSKELYRLLRQFRHTGLLRISKENLKKTLSVPRTYDEYEFIRKIVRPAIVDNDKYFNKLKIRNLEGKGNSLPETCDFVFVKHERMYKNPISKAKNKNEYATEEDSELLEYIAEHGGKPST